MEGARHQYAWCTCECEYKLQPLAWIITRRVASNFRNCRWACQVISGDSNRSWLFSCRRKNAAYSVAESTPSTSNQTCNQPSDIFSLWKRLPPRFEPARIYETLSHVINYRSRLLRSTSICETYSSFAMRRSSSHLTVIMIYLCCGNRLLVSPQLTLSVSLRRDKYWATFQFCLNNRFTSYFESALESKLLSLRSNLTRL